MADSDKNIVITPQTSQTSDPTIEFKSGATSGDPITLNVTDDGTTSSLSFEGSAGQLFSISNDLTGTIFAVADGSGIPIIEADADGTVRIAEFGGQLNLGGPIIEAADIVGTASSSYNIDVLDNNVRFVTADATANWSFNIRGSSGTTLNSVLGTGDSITVVFLATNGTTPYYNTSFTIDSAAQTVKWQLGSAPTAGNASSIDVYTFTIFKTAASTYTVLGNQAQFA